MHDGRLKGAVLVPLDPWDMFQVDAVNANPGPALRRIRLKDEDTGEYGTVFIRHQDGRDLVPSGSGFYASVGTAFGAAGPEDADRDGYEG
jgi:hypothetical protein